LLCEVYLSYISLWKVKKGFFSVYLRTVKFIKDCIGRYNPDTPRKSDIRFYTRNESGESGRNEFDYPGMAWVSRSCSVPAATSATRRTPSVSFRSPYNGCPDSQEVFRPLFKPHCYAPLETPLTTLHTPDPRSLCPSECHLAHDFQYLRSSSARRSVPRGRD